MLQADWWQAGGDAAVLRVLPCTQMLPAAGNSLKSRHCSALWLHGRGTNLLVDNCYIRQQHMYCCCKHAQGTLIAGCTQLIAGPIMSLHCTETCSCARLLCCSELWQDGPRPPPSPGHDFPGYRRLQKRAAQQQVAGAAPLAGSTYHSHQHRKHAP